MNSSSNTYALVRTPDPDPAHLARGVNLSGPSGVAADTGTSAERADVPFTRRFAPPLVITKEQLDECCSIVEQAVDEF